MNETNDTQGNWDKYPTCGGLYGSENCTECQSCFDDLFEDEDAGVPDTQDDDNIIDGTATEVPDESNDAEDNGDSDETE